MIKLKLWDMIADSLALARTQRMNRITVGTFFNTLQKVVAMGNYVSDAPGRAFNIGESSTQINNKRGSVITEKGSKN